MKEGEYPRARVDCLSREFGDELLVYDRQRNVGHCLVTSLVAPTPARAASCLANGKPCVSPAQCCSGKCGVTSGHCGG